MTAIQKKRTFLILFYWLHLFWSSRFVFWYCCKEHGTIGTTWSFLTKFTDYYGRFESILLQNFFVNNFLKMFWECFLLYFFVKSLFQMSRKEFSITTFEKLKKVLLRFDESFQWDEEVRNFKIIHWEQMHAFSQTVLLCEVVIVPETSILDKTSLRSKV